MEISEIEAAILETLSDGRACSALMLSCRFSVRDEDVIKALRSLADRGKVAAWGPCDNPLWVKTVELDLSAQQ